MSILTPIVSASTLSVLMNESDSITCYLELNEESCNLTLRLENDKAKLSGFPQSWRTWDEVIVGDIDSKTYEDAEMDGSLDSFVDEIESMDAYVSRDTEKEIFKQLKESLKKQFEDEMFKDQLSLSQKEIALQKIDLAIANL